MALRLSSREDWDTEAEREEDGAQRNPYAAWEWGMAKRNAGDSIGASETHSLAAFAFKDIGDKPRSAIAALDAGIDLAGTDKVKETKELLENAIKYGFDGSDITLAITMVTPHHVRVDVTNFGEGIEERHLPRLTERFYRIDKARSRQIGGTGLGLAIVKHIVNRHRGSLSITSTLGETTRFSVDFPLAPPVTPQ